MKKLLIIFSLIIVLQTNSLAANLSQALLEAYINNAELNAERENINVSKKNLDISKSEFLPTITLKGSKSSENTSKLTNQDGTSATVTDVNPETRSVKIEQKIFQGFGGVADYEKNKIGLVLADAKLLQTEQKILLKAVEAFSGLIFAKEKFSINKRNVNLSERQVETDRIRLDRGQVSVADLAQSESSLAGSQAKFIQAKNNVITAKLNYENIIGPIQDSSDLNKNINLNLKIPLTLENAIQLSKTNNPDLIIAKLEYEQSKRDVKIAQSDLAPSATLSFESKETDDLSSTYDQQNKETVEATITWPIFSGGKNYAELSKSKNLRNRKKLLFDNALKVNDTNVASAWSNMKSNGSLLESVKLQVKAAEIANEGITAEYESGKGRSTLDVIQSNSILLNSKISLANSEREYLLSQFRFLQSVGILSANYLGLNK
tara:strand:+ start:601 stop:1902 length:1302 start_codon:yes stop_codon:yes gene_type:complete